MSKYQAPNKNGVSTLARTKAWGKSHSLNLTDRRVDTLGPPYPQGLLQAYQLALVALQELITLSTPHFEPLARRRLIAALDSKLTI